MKLVSVIFTLGVLGGCSPYAKDFDCGIGRGVPCTSLTDINKLIDQNRLPSPPPPSTPQEESWVEAYIPANGHRYVIGR